MRVRSFFLLCLAGVAALALIANAALLGGQWARLRAAADAGQLAAAMRDVLLLDEKLTAERGLRNVALVAPDPAAGEARARLDRAAAAVDAAFAVARTTLAGSPLPALAGRLDDVGGGLGALRTDADAALRLNRADRPMTSEAFLSRMAGVVDAVDGLATALAGPLGGDLPRAGTLAALARQAWDMRDQGGRRATEIVPMVAERRIAPERMEAAASAAGAIGHAWSNLLALAQQVPDSTAVAQAAKEARSRYFDGTKAVLDPLLEALRTGTPPPFTPAETRDKLIAAAATILPVRDAALAAALEEAAAARADARAALAGGAALLALLAGGAAVLGAAFTRRVVAPLGALTDAIARIAGGERTLVVPARGRRDEIGRMAEALETLRGNAEAADHAAAAHRAAQAARTVRADAIEAAARRFDGETATLVARLGEVGAVLREAVQAAAALSAETLTRSVSVAGASGQASASSAMIAGASEQLAGSVGAIAREVAESGAKVRHAVAIAGEADRRIAGLAEAAGRIGEVLALIDGIAGQTSLLALNATIEAARAGEAGRGFAVVAGEVKTLAAQTARATGDIAAQVAAIRQGTDASVAAIKEVGEAVAALSAISARVADAVADQGVATHEIARAIGEAAGSSRQASTDAEAMRAAAATGEQAAARMLAATEDLAAGSSALTRLIRGFVAELRAA